MAIALKIHAVPRGKTLQMLFLVAFKGTPRLHAHDPFDSMLVAAQALVEDVTQVTADTALRNYNCPLLWASES